MNASVLSALAPAPAPANTAALALALPAAACTITHQHQRQRQVQPGGPSLYPWAFCLARGVAGPASRVVGPMPFTAAHVAAHRRVVGVLASAARPPEPLLRAFARALVAPTTRAEKEAFEEDHILKLEV